MNWLSNLDAYKSKQACKSALAATLATAITLAFHMPHPFWAPAIVIMLMDDYTEGSAKKGVTRSLSTIAGAAFAYFLGHFTLAWGEISYYIAIFTVITVVIYGVLVSGTAWLNFGVTFLFLTMYMVMDPSGSFEIAIWRSSEILTGVFCGVLVSLLFFPSNITRDIQNNVKTLIADSQTLLANMQNALTNNTELSWKTDKTAFRASLEKVSSLQSLLSSSGKKGVLRDDLGVLLNQGWSWWRQSGQLYVLINQDSALKPALLPLLQSVSNLLTQWSQCVTEHKNLTPNLDSLMQEIDAAMSPIVAHAISTRDHGHYALLQTWLNTLESWLNTLKQYLDHQSFTSTKPQTVPTLKESVHRIYIKLMSKRSLLPHCFAIALGCCLVTYVWLLTGWPGGVCAGISALVVGADSSLSKINLKIRLRLFGSILGATLGMLVFIFLVHNVISMLIAVFIGVAIFGYISQGGFAPMYVCWMATMGYVITVVPDLTQTTDIGFTFERAFGLVMGLVVMAFVVNFFWPLNYKNQLKELCNNIKKKMTVYWSCLQNTTPENLAYNATTGKDIQQQLMGLVGQGNAIAKPNGIMKAWSPSIEVIITLPWCGNYITNKALSYLQQHFPDQWQQLCQQTHHAIAANDASALTEIQHAWEAWADQLQVANANDDQKDVISQSWLMLQSNGRFCELLAKNTLLLSGSIPSENAENNATAQPASQNASA